MQYRRGALKNRANTAAHANYTDAQALLDLNEAQQEFQRILDISILKDSSTAMVAGQELYDLPRNRMARALRTVSIKSWDNRIVPIQFLPEEAFDAAFQRTEDQGWWGEPAFWTFSRTRGKVKLRPTPQRNAANGVIYNYAPILEPMGSCFYSVNASLTCEVTRGSNIVALSDDFPANAIQPGWEFGAIYTTNINTAQSTSADSDIPRRWQEIDECEDDEIVLFEDFPDPSATGLRFICGEIPDIELAQPGQYGFGVVHMALAQFFGMIGDPQGEYHAAQAEKFISRPTYDPPTETDIRVFGRLSWLNPYPS